MADQLPTPPVAEAPVTQPIAPALPTQEHPAQGFGINFIRDQRKALDEHLEQDKKIARYTMYGLSLFILLLIAVMSIYYLLSLEQRKTAELVTNATTQLSSMTTLEKEYIIYAKKIKLLAAVDMERTIKRNATSFFYALIPPVNVMREVRTDDEKNKDTILFTIQSPDVFALLDVLKRFGEKDVYDKGYIITVNTLNRSADGTYAFDGAMNYARANDLATGGAPK